MAFQPYLILISRFEPLIENPSCFRGFREGIELLKSNSRASNLYLSNIQTGVLHDQSDMEAYTHVTF